MIQRMTNCGPIKGLKQPLHAYEEYRGIRYATAGRYEYPVEVNHWEGEYDATAFKAACYQPRAFHPEGQDPDKSFYYNEFRKGTDFTYSEDCQYLNIFVPEGAKPGDDLPVLLYIHGGEFLGGCGHEKHFHTPSWPRHGCICVTINYRLGPLGFLSLPEEQHTGNYGLYDQFTALKWVYHNIASFGGDPSNITLIGQSAGAMSVQLLCCSALTKGLIAKAVLISGGGYIPGFHVEQDVEDQKNFTRSIMKECGIDHDAELRSLPVEKLFEGFMNAKKNFKGMLACSPVIDGELITKHVAECATSQDFLKIPYLLGSTKDDMGQPMFHMMSENWCKAQQLPVWLYHFDHDLPGDDAGSFHSGDLWYWFGTHHNSWRPMQKIDDDLSDLMVDYLTSFAKTGDPNTKGRPTWKSYQDSDHQALLFSDEPARMIHVEFKKEGK